MGLFSTKKKYHVDNAIVRVVEDNLVPDMKLTALASSIINDTSLTKELLDQTLNGTFRNFEKYYNYGKKGPENDGYIHGLPNVFIRNNNEGEEIVRGILESQHGQAVDIEYVRFRPMSNFHAGWNHLVENEGYSHRHNVLGNLSAEKRAFVFLQRVVAIVPQNDEAEPSAARLDQQEPINTLLTGGNPPGWELFFEDFGLDNEGQEDAAVIPAFVQMMTHWIVPEETRIVGAGEPYGFEYYYTWRDAEGTTHEEMEYINLEDQWDMTEEYYQAKYSTEHTDADGVEYQKWYFWIYKPDPEGGLYPELDNLFERPEFVDPGTYFPFVMFRDNKEDQTNNPNAEHYASSKKLLKYLGMNYADVGEQIHENPDIADVSQAALVMAVPLDSEEPVEIDYLHRYFGAMYDRLPPEGKNSLQSISQLQSGNTYIDLNRYSGWDADETYALEITDANLRMVFSFDGIAKRYVAGELENDPDTGYGKVGALTNEYVEVERDPTWGDRDGGLNQTLHVIKKQITPHVWEEIQVLNAKMRYDVVKGKGVVSGGNDERLMVPLDYEICQEFDLFEKERLYYRSLHMLFNSFVVEKVKWYERGVFKTLLTIVAVVITIYTLGKTWQTVVAAAGVGTATSAIVAAFLKAILIKIIIGTGISYALVYVIEELGIQNALLVAAVLVVAAVYAPEEAAENAGAIMQHFTAEKLLMAATSIANSAQQVMQEMFADLATDIELQQALQEEKWGELEEVSELLQTDSLIDPFAFIGRSSTIIPGDTADAYYYRSVHAGNIGVRSIEIIENFVDQSLTLPDLSDSYGQPFYGTV